jgi:hypothetical protein
MGIRADGLTPGDCGGTDEERVTCSVLSYEFPVASEEQTTAGATADSYGNDKSKATTKYGGLSATAAKNAAFGRDDNFKSGVEMTRSMGGAR